LESFSSTLLLSHISSPCCSGTMTLLF
jgi:hypothetical protein